MEQAHSQEVETPEAVRQETATSERPAPFSSLLTLQGAAGNNAVAGLLSAPARARRSLSAIDLAARVLPRPPTGSLGAGPRVQRLGVPGGYVGPSLTVQRKGGKGGGPMGMASSALGAAGGAAGKLGAPSAVGQGIGMAQQGLGAYQQGGVGGLVGAGAGMLGNAVGGKGGGLINKLGGMAPGVISKLGG